MGEQTVHTTTKTPPELDLKIINLAISDLKLDPTNPRIHSKKQIKQLARSIKTFGFLLPILVDALWRVIAGHCRIAAAMILGLKEVPVICARHLSEAQLKAYMIADNRLAEQASWDEKLLGEHFKALSEIDLDFELEATGFEVGEIDLLIEGLSPNVDSECDPADELPEIDSAEVASEGDLWLLGRHRIYCGNSENANSYPVVMEGERATTVFADPPYNVPIPGHVTGHGSLGIEISKWPLAR